MIFFGRKRWPPRSPSLFSWAHAAGSGGIGVHPFHFAAALYRCSSFQLYREQDGAFFHTGLDLLSGVWENWNELDALRKENESLRAEQAQYSEILAENIRLKSLLSFKQGYKQYHLTGLLSSPATTGMDTDAGRRPRQ